MRGESLAFRLRGGQRSSNTAADHIAVLDEALAQIQSRRRRDVLVTVDGAGTTLDLVRHITTLGAVPGRRVHYSWSSTLMIGPHRHRSRTGIGVGSGVRHRREPPRPGRRRGGELTGLLRKHPDGDWLASWPVDMRGICRRERPSAGAQLSLLEEADGWGLPADRHQPPNRAACLPQGHHPHARVQDDIRWAKDTGIEHLPSKSYGINQPWCVAAMIATDLLCCGCCAFTGESASSVMSRSLS